MMDKYTHNKYHIYIMIIPVESNERDKYIHE